MYRHGKGTAFLARASKVDATFCTEENKLKNERGVRFWFSLVELYVNMPSDFRTNANEALLSIEHMWDGQEETAGEFFIYDVSA